MPPEAFIQCFDRQSLINAQAARNVRVMIRLRNPAVLTPEARNWTYMHVLDAVQPELSRPAPTLTSRLTCWQMSHCQGSRQLR